MLIGMATIALAQEPPKPDELKKMYDDALAQLKAAQERKNELGNENEQLKSRLGELEKKLAETQSRADELQAQVNSAADQTFFLRSHYAAWEHFLTRYPNLMAQWKLFLEGGVLSASPQQEPRWFEPDWPLSALSEPNP
jgi:septal ring factor EnvC (AmiA/AmiB activator)